MRIFKSLFGGGRTLSAMIDPGCLRVRVQPWQTLLEAALAAGIAFPNNCRVGSCASCRCRLLQGRVKALTDASYALSEEELRAGYILACQSLLKTDIRVVVDDIKASDTDNQKVEVHKL